MKDWKGNTRSTFATLGASTHSDYDREENDYYATDPKAAELLLEVEPELTDIWEPACGAGHLAGVFEQYNKLAAATDLIDRGYGKPNVDFLKSSHHHNGDTVTNPPFRYALEFVQKSLDLIPEGRKIAMFLRIQFLEGKARRKIFDEHPPKTVYVATSRIKCAMNGDFESTKGSAALYAWFVWQKGVEGGNCGSVDKLKGLTVGRTVYRISYAVIHRVRNECVKRLDAFRRRCIYSIEGTVVSFSFCHYRFEI